MRRHSGTFWIIVITGLMAIPVIGGTMVERSNADALLPPNDETILNDYLVGMKRSGMVYAQVEKPSGPPVIDLEEPEETGVTGRKSPLKAFLLSAAVPGAGQLYTGSKLKAAAFFGIEALSWAGYITYHGKGDDKTDFFEAFADAHWSENRYEDFLFENWGVRDDDQIGRFTHHLPDTKTQQYYEMIGKYNQFVFGWDDVDTTVTPPLEENVNTAYSANREHYENLRHDANVMYSRATASLIVMMVNHVVSGAEAALAARNHNKNVQDEEQRLSVRAVTAQIDDSYFPMLTMTYTF